MTAAWDATEAARLVAETLEDDARMTPVPWSKTNDIQRVDVLGDFLVVCRVNLAHDDATDQEHANAAGIASLRNNAKPLADQLEAAMVEVTRLTKLHDDEDRTSSQLIDERDFREKQINTIADTLGDEGEWSNLHDRGTAAIELADSLIAERDQLRAEVERLTARHNSSMRYLRDVENMASTGTQTAVTREDGDGTLRLAIFRDIRTAARAAIAGDGLRLNEAVEIERLHADAASMHPIVEAAVAFREALRDEDNECVVEHNALMGAVDTFLARKP